MKQHHPGNWFNAIKRPQMLHEMFASNNRNESGRITSEMLLRHWQIYRAKETARKFYSNSALNADIQHWKCWKSSVWTWKRERTYEEKKCIQLRQRKCCEILILFRIISTFFLLFFFCFSHCQPTIFSLSLIAFYHINFFRFLFIVQFTCLFALPTVEMLSMRTPIILLSLQSL